MKRKPKKKKLNMLIFHGSRLMNHWVHRADLFEGCKAFAQPHFYTVTLKPRCTIKRAIKDMQTILKKCDQEVVCIIELKTKQFFHDGITRAISNGKEWSLLKDWTEPFGIKLPEP